MYLINQSTSNTQTNRAQLVSELDSTWIEEDKLEDYLHALSEFPSVMNCFVISKLFLNFFLLTGSFYEECYA